MSPPSADGDCVADTGNGEALLGGSGGEQCAGTAEKDLFQFAGAELSQKIAA